MAANASPHDRELDQQLKPRPELLEAREVHITIKQEMADRVGFEPTVSFHPRRFSRPLP